MPTTENDIDNLAARFYGFFDNREGRVPDRRAVPEIFLPDTRILCRSDGHLHSWSLEAFLEPRIAWLSDGTLMDFHEWETEATTTVFGGMASRFSVYRKSGQRDNHPFEGGGRKLLHLCHVAEGWRIASLLWEDG